MDDIMYGKMQAAEYPRIYYRLTEFTLKEAAKAKDAPYVFEANGELAVAGVTNKVTMPVNVTPARGGQDPHHRHRQNQDDRFQNRAALAGPGRRHDQNRGCHYAPVRLDRGQIQGGQIAAFRFFSISGRDAVSSVPISRPAVSDKIRRREAARAFWARPAEGGARRRTGCAVRQSCRGLQHSRTLARVTGPALFPPGFGLRESSRALGSVGCAGLARQIARPL